jgi:transcription elongation factor Elf1
MGRNKKPPPTGYTCKTCGRENVFSNYTRKNWDTVLVHHCRCGAEHDVLHGRAKQIKKGQVNEDAA